MKLKTPKYFKNSKVTKFHSCNLPMSWLCNFFPNQSLLFTSSCSTITYPHAYHVYYRIFEYIHVRSRTKTLKTRKKFSKFRKQSRLGREKVSKIKSTSNTNFEKAPISRKQTIFRIKIIYYRTSCTLVIQQSGFSGQQVFKSKDITNGLWDQRTKKSFPCHSNGDFGSKFPS